MTLSRCCRIHSQPLRYCCCLAASLRRQLHSLLCELQSTTDQSALNWGILLHSEAVKYPLHKSCDRQQEPGSFQREMIREMSVTREPDAVVRHSHYVSRATDEKEIESSSCQSPKFYRCGNQLSQQLQNGFLAFHVSLRSRRPLSPNLSKPRLLQHPERCDVAHRNASM